MRSLLPLLLLLLTSFLPTSARGQDTQSAKPAPTPASPRRSFDQFDLDGGVQIVSTSRANTTDIGDPVALETVSRETYSRVIMMIDYGTSMEREYRSGISMDIDASDYFAPDNLLRRKLPALYRTIEIFKSGLLSQAKLNSNGNVAILKDNQSIIEDMMAVLILVPKDDALAAGRLKSISDRYSPNSESDSTVIVKKDLLLAMFARLSDNFAKLGNQVTIAK